ncbi:ATP-binding domain-containing protein [Parahaliea sp. F7430]|uniref:ATP-binding domain-containing protein n=1 Tax=Sediminihaliea albiluteola TaxID=2758564 RepID=A0A7W2TTR8_9GAMM|nr:ATP-binding domain-containing protein [Sediminihaliea albiluteola]MBA6411766.1 ATP-binding domain-containing protein [Sediminihaliea albiluteola]
MQEIGFTSLAKETLSTFDEIANVASDKLGNNERPGNDSFASGNTLTGGAAYQNLAGIQQEQREAMQKLCAEPAIVRLVLEGDDESQRVIYIARASNLLLPSKTEFASYRSPLGRFAEIPPGDEASIVIGGKECRYWVIEKTSYQPEHNADGWDSRQTQYRHYNNGSYSIESLRALLQAERLDSADELDRLLEQAEVQGGVVAGISHQVRTAMGLRDQPVLDQFQGEIFRLPLKSRLMILGPPGTGKTTTLIKRLGQKLDLESLDADERRIAESASHQRPHQSSWLMFTPSELLKQYLKEAFNREQVPASDAHIRTWVSLRNDIARNTLGILRSANGGRFTLKNDLLPVKAEVVSDASVWYDAFQEHHEMRLRQQLLDGLAIVQAADPEGEQKVLQQLETLAVTLKNRPLIEIYRSLESEEDSLKQALKNSRAIADEMLKKERNRLYNKDNDVFHRLAQYLKTLQQDNEQDDEDVFDDDDQEETAAPTHNAIQVAVKSYLSALKALARNKYLKRSMPKGSRSGLVVQFLGDAIPSIEVLVEIGRHISFQNGLRRFINSHKRYVTDIPTSYPRFRKDKAARADFYTSDVISANQLAGIELDAIILLMLKNARQLLEQSFISRAIDEPRFSYLYNITEMFRNQIMVDEATDFSMLELACMESLAAPSTQSFFACGDFNQRITTTGIRTLKQLNWLSPSLSIRSVQLVYRQSRKLNAFAGELLRLQCGDLSALGQVPEESNHEGVSPVLCEGATGDEAMCWIADRIKEVEKEVQQLPTIAVLVNSELEVKTTAERLSHYLEEVNLSAVACEEGKALGEGTDVRVFDIQHIKGLEFEAVFFVGIDELAMQKPELFDRFLYVGATRAATYLGLVCNEVLPERLEPLRSTFAKQWAV